MTDADAGWRPFSAVERAMTARMTRLTGVPIATEWVDVDVSAAFALERDLRARGEDVTFTTIVLGAVADALALQPQLAAEVDFERKRLRIPDEIDVGVAVASDRGLIVPVVRDVVNKSFPELAADLRRVVALARDGAKDQSLYRGGHFTVTNIAAGGVHGGIPLPNFPQPAILGVAAARPVAVVRDGEVVPSHLCQLAVSLDHRTLDGITVARFLSRLRTLIEAPHLLLDTNHEVDAK